MKIADIRTPDLFQRLVQRLFVAERGESFQIVDDSAGDRGNDGYDRARGILYSIYCPEKPETADYRRKASADLAKAIRLKVTPGYSITDWVFVTPGALREALQADLRAEAEKNGLTAAFLSSTHLEDLYRRHPQLRDDFPELEYPTVAKELEQIREIMEAIKVAAAPAPSSKPAVSRPQSPSTGVLVGLISPRLERIYARAEAGDQAAFGELDRYVMEAVDLRDHLDGVVLTLQLAADRNDHQRAQQLSAQGLARARAGKLAAETAVFAANLAFYKAVSLTNRELQFEMDLETTRRIGVPFTSLEQIAEAERPLLQQRAELAQLLSEARNAAVASNNLMALFVTAVRQGMTLSQRRWGAALRLQLSSDSDAATFLTSLVQQIEEAYGAAIRAAAAMKSDIHLAIAYGNLANELHSFGDDMRAEQHARHALELGQATGYTLQVEKTRKLLQLIEAKRGGSAPRVT